ASSSYWTDTTTEYGVGKYTVAPSIVLNGPPTTISDTQIHQFIASQADGNHSPWPKANAKTLVAMFYPSTTTITQGQGSRCNSFGGYHNDYHLADNTPFAYAVLPRCAGGLTTLTAALSHEVVEAATDPFPQTAPGFAQVDNDHLIWEFSNSGGEVGDMCEM